MKYPLQVQGKGNFSVTLATVARQCLFPESWASSQDDIFLDWKWNIETTANACVIQLLCWIFWWHFSGIQVAGIPLDRRMTSSCSESFNLKPNSNFDRSVNSSNAGGMWVAAKRCLLGTTQLPLRPPPVRQQHHQLLGVAPSNHN